MSVFGGESQRLSSCCFIIFWDSTAVINVYCGGYDNGQCVQKRSVESMMREYAGYYGRRNVGERGGKVWEDRFVSKCGFSFFFWIWDVFYRLICT